MTEFNDKRVYTLYAGANGAGKSTIYKIMNPGTQDKWVNSDEILISNGGNWKNEKDQWKAMKEAAVRIKRYIREGISFNQEITLAGRTNVKTILTAKEQGFLIRLYYVGLSDADLAVIYDNTEEFRKIAKYEEGRWIYYETNCNWFNKSIRCLDYR